MRISRILVTTAAAGAALILSTGPAMAGEITGNGKPTQGPAHANSICAFSGLEDGDGAGFPGPGGSTATELGTQQGGVRRDSG